MTIMGGVIILHIVCRTCRVTDRVTSTSYRKSQTKILKLSRNTTPNVWDWGDELHLGSDTKESDPSRWTGKD